jgi:hypothetical protein
MNYLTVERFLVNQEPLAGDTGGFTVGDIVSSSATKNWKVIAMAQSIGKNGISCLVEQPSTQSFRGDEPWSGNGWQHGYNEQGEYVVRRVLKYHSLILVTKRSDSEQKVDNHA